MRAPRSRDSKDVRRQRGVLLHSDAWRFSGRRFPHPARLYSLAMGVGYLGLGIYGFTVAGGMKTGYLLHTSFPLNGPHDAFHVLVGILGFAAAYYERDFLYARTMSFVFGILWVTGYLGQPTFGILPLGGADLFLHGMTAIVADAIARLEKTRELQSEIEELEERFEGESAG